MAWVWSGVSSSDGVPVSPERLAAAQGPTVTTPAAGGGRALDRSASATTAPAPFLAGGAFDPASDHVAAAERWLESRPAEPAVVRVGAYAAVAGLEDRIAQLDDLLSAARAEGMQPSRLSALEAQRTRLVSSLAQVRYAEILVAASPR